MSNRSGQWSLMKPALNFAVFDTACIPGCTFKGVVVHAHYGLLIISGTPSIGSAMAFEVFLITGRVFISLRKASFPRRVSAVRRSGESSLFNFLQVGGLDLVFCGFSITT
ncbi:hypothetical protein CEXT_400381 [Caerostris extrusa]|uniref:Uncharacterized protein n=1 Tax=Caerostris extrusa TaxID=172846 RepID=A0AAV4Q5B8_CAEEX|nr:hypothetical protein CEXT_400381 [Caerostris extrusa]